MYTESFNIHVKTDDIYKDIETRFNNSNYEIDLCLWKNKQVIELMKDELGR